MNWEKHMRFGFYSFAKLRFSVKLMKQDPFNLSNAQM